MTCGWSARKLSKFSENSPLKFDTRLLLQKYCRKVYNIDVDCDQVIKTFTPKHSGLVNEVIEQDS